MWTAGHLIGAMAFASLGYGAAVVATSTFPEGTPATWFPATIAGIGLWQGWYVMGARTGRGYRAAMGNGMRVGIQIAFFGLLLFSLREMFLRSGQLRYSGLADAVLASFDLFIDYALQSLTMPVLAVLIVGGVTGGALTEVAARIWR